MAQHVFSWVAGFGWTVVPQAPFHAGRAPGSPRTVFIRHHAPGGDKEAAVTISDDGEASHQLTDGVEKLEDVLDLVRGAAYPEWEGGAAHDHWRVETSLFSVRWPEGFVVVSNPQPPVFDLAGPGGSLVWLQGPFAEAKVPPVGEMIAPGQTPVQVGAWEAGPFVELAYEHEGQPWRQWHCRLESLAGSGHLVVVTGQSPEGHADEVRAAVAEVADSFRLCG